MATHSSVLAWKIPWTEEPGGLQSMGSQRVTHDWGTEHKNLLDYKPAGQSHSSPRSSLCPVQPSCHLRRFQAEVYICLHVPQEASYSKVLFPSKPTRICSSTRMQTGSKMPVSPDPSKEFSCDDLSLALKDKMESMPTLLHHTASFPRISSCPLLKDLEVSAIQTDHGWWSWIAQWADCPITGLVGSVHRFL